MKNFLVTIVSTALLVGCAGTKHPTHLYTLATPMASSLATPAVTSGALAIELAPVSMPERLARPQMVIHEADRFGGGQLFVLEQHRWIASFESELRDALSTGIATRLGAVDHSRSVGSSNSAAYRIAVQVREFDAVNSVGVSVAFGWTVKNVSASTSSSYQLVLSEKATGTGVDALALAAQGLVGRMSDAVAQSVRESVPLPALTTRTP